MRWLALSALLLVALAASGCGSLNDQYVEADRATFDAVASRYKMYVDADPNLTPLQKKSKKNTIDSWEARLTGAEDFLRKKTPDEQAQEDPMWGAWERVWYGVRRKDE